MKRILTELEKYKRRQRSEIYRLQKKVDEQAGGVERIDGKTRAQWKLQKRKREAADLKLAEMIGVQDVENMGSFTIFRPKKPES